MIDDNKQSFNSNRKSSLDCDVSEASKLALRLSIIWDTREE